METLKDTRREAEKKAIQKALRKSKGNVAEASRLLGTGVRTIWLRIEELSIDYEAFRN